MQSAEQPPTLSEETVRARFNVEHQKGRTWSPRNGPTIATVLAAYETEGARVLLRSDDVSAVHIRGSVYAFGVVEGLLVEALIDVNIGYWPAPPPLNNYRVHNPTTCHDFGVIRAQGANEALDALAQDMGHKNYVAFAEAGGVAIADEIED